MDMTVAFIKRLVATDLTERVKKEGGIIALKWIKSKKKEICDFVNSKIDIPFKDEKEEQEYIEAGWEAGMEMLEKLASKEKDNK